jgi:hypothetical protein
MTSKLEFNLAYRIVGIDATPYCLDYWCEFVLFDMIFLKSSFIGRIWKIQMMRY